MVEMIREKGVFFWRQCILFYIVKGEKKELGDWGGHFYILLISVRHFDQIYEDPVKSYVRAKHRTEMEIPF